MTKNKQDLEQVVTDGGIQIEMGEVVKAQREDKPFVIVPVGGQWANDAQAEYARFLNAYAYKNPDKFAIKKEKLRKELASLEKEPWLLQKYTGQSSNDKQKIVFSNKLIQE